MAELASEQYARVFDALPDGTIVTYGNVDIPPVLLSLLVISAIRRLAR